MPEQRLDLPNIDTELFEQPDIQPLPAPPPANHAPRVLLLSGSVRERSYSRLTAQ